jgi:hypothetical protein
MGESGCFSEAAGWDLIRSHIHGHFVQASSRPLEPDRELLEPEPEPGAWVLVPSTAGYAAPRPGNDGYPRRGGRTRLVTTPEIARVPFSRVQSGCTRRYYLPLLVPTPDISSCPVVVHLQINPASTLFVSLANLLRVSQAAPPSSTSPCRELCLLFFLFLSISIFQVFPPSPSWGSRSLLFVPRRPHFASPLEAALLHSRKKKTPSIHPSRLAPRPGLASPALTAHRPPSCRCYWTSNWAGQPLTRPGLVLVVCLRFAIHSPAAFSSPCVRPPRRSQTIRLFFLTHPQSKTPAALP